MIFKKDKLLSFVPRKLSWIETLERAKNSITSNRRLLEDGNPASGQVFSAFDAINSMQRTPTPQNEYTMIAKHLQGQILLATWTMFSKEHDPLARLRILEENVKMLREELEEPSNEDFLEFSARYRKHIKCLHDFLS